MNKLIAEFIGTFTLIFAGVSAICNNAGLVGVALAHGLALVVMVSALGAVSGAHFNPAVTIGILVGGKISPAEAVKYIIAQLLGAVAGAWVVTQGFTPEVVAATKLGVPALGAGVSIGTGLLYEAIMTFFLVIVVFGTAVDGRAPKLGGLFIGLTVTMDILAGGPVTGAAMNCARAFGPALIGGHWENHWVYWVGPILGGGIGGAIYSKVFSVR